MLEARSIVAVGSVLLRVVGFQRVLGGWLNLKNKTRTPKKTAKQTRRENK